MFGSSLELTHHERIMHRELNTDRGNKSAKLWC